MGNQNSGRKATPIRQASDLDMDTTAVIASLSRWDRCKHEVLHELVKVTRRQSELLQNVLIIGHKQAELHKKMGEQACQRQDIYSRMAS